MKTGILIIAAFLIIAAGSAEAIVVDSQGPDGTWENVSVDTRPGLQVSYLLGQPKNAGERSVFLLFNGGEGAGTYELLNDGTINLSVSFLARTAPLFVRDGVSVAIMQPPSDRVRGGMSCGFRASEDHLQDIGKVIESLAHRGFERIFLTGHSNGTFSAAFAGSRIENNRIKGVVLLSSISTLWHCYIGPYISTVRYRVLMVHHRDDGCRVTPFSGAKKLFSALPPKAAFVEVRGGADPRGDACRSLHRHAFVGREKEVIETITDWAGTGKAPEIIGE
jgi:hypothetical protein